jgi:hypothetical protein
MLWKCLFGGEKGVTRRGIAERILDYSCAICQAILIYVPGINISLHRVDMMRRTLHAGDTADAMFVIVEGSCYVHVRGREEVGMLSQTGFPDPVASRSKRGAKGYPTGKRRTVWAGNPLPSVVWEHISRMSTHSECGALS